MASSMYAAMSDPMMSAPVGSMRAPRLVNSKLLGTLEGHKKCVTQLATTPSNENILLSSSRDKSLLVWRVTATDPCRIAVAYKSFHGHGQAVSDVVFSSDGMFALSGSWDRTLRLWDVRSGVCTRKFFGHQGDVMSVSFSGDNRQIVSGSRDKTIKLWNTLGSCKYTMSDECNDWVSCVRFSPDQNHPTVVSAGWDKTVKVWNLKNCKLKCVHQGHTGYLNTVGIAPDGSICASGGRDGKAVVWDILENRFMRSFDGVETINAICFSPSRFWIAVAAGSNIRIYDIHSDNVLFDEIPAEGNKTECTSLAWSPNATLLYAGYADGKIRVFGMEPLAP